MLTSIAATAAAHTANMPASRTTRIYTQAAGKRISSTSCGFIIIIIIINRPAASATQSNGNRQLPDPTQGPCKNT
jgi:hypothetical protein